MKTRHPSSTVLKLSTAAAIALLSLNACSSPAQDVARSPETNADLTVLRDAIAQVKARYVEPADDDKLLTDAMKGMLTGLDAHSDYMTAKELRELRIRSHGEFAGIGAELTREDKRPKVISPIDDTPAARAGILPGDLIVRIDDQPTDSLSLDEVVERLRGPVGTTVRVTIARSGKQPFDVPLQRAVIRVMSVKSRLEPGRVGYVRISSFAERTHDDLVAALDRLQREAGGTLDGLILDLRNDPGGLLQAAIDVSSDFIDGGTVVSTRGRTPGDDRIYVARSGGDRLKGVPMVVLINGASASAAEIVAGALKDHRRAALLGTRSFGKGSVQTILPIGGRGALRLTTARYYTPSGQSIQGQGITPDVIVTAAKDEQARGALPIHEANLKGALRNTGPIGGPGGAASASPGASGAAAGAAPDEEGGAIDPMIIGTARDTQLAAALAALRDMAANQSGRDRR